MYETVPALITPIIIIGGIISGFFTATEAAAVASLYTLLISMFFYKTLKLSDMPKILMDTLALSSLSLFALAAASALGELMSYYQLSTMAQDFFVNNVWAKRVFILIIIAFFLFVGTLW
ncbi:TRAP transporter large permease subunit [Cytobacillus firmus]|uniref:TRAP transporter large permease subunit n=1 Tax=Cytobacillus firmus TaxID=1399 RepID=UPI002814F204|nr:TRAP transporter large permease subunit [Cytobacillus firmus]